MVKKTQGFSPMRFLIFAKFNKNFYHCTQFQEKCVLPENINQDQFSIGIMSLRIFFIFFLAIPILVFGQEKSSHDVENMQDTVKLSEVSVVSNRKVKVSGMLTGDLKLQTQELQSIPSLTGTVDVLKLMELTPSVRTSSDGSTNMYVRGGDAGQNRILYNNVTTYTSGHALGIFPLYNAEHLSWVKMSKGIGDAQQGNYISSLIEVNSREEIPSDLSIKGNVGVLATQLSLDIPISNNWGAYLSVRKTYIDLLVMPLIESLTQKDNPDKDTDMSYNFEDLNLTLLGKINNKHSLSIDLLLSDDKLNIKDQEIILDGSLKWQNFLFGTTLKSNLSANLNLDQTITVSHYNNKLYTEQADLHAKVRSQIDNIGYKNKFYFSVYDLPFTMGVTYTYHHILPNEVDFVNSEIKLNPRDEYKIESHDASLFLTTKLNPISKLKINPSIRYNFFHSKTNIKEGTKNFRSVDFRLSAQYQLREYSFLRVNFSHNNQYTNKLTPSSVGLPTDFWIAATKDLKPQSGNEISVGYYHLLDNAGIELSGDIYYRSMKNVTQFDYNFIEYDNSIFVDKILYGKGRAYGLEVMLKKNFDELTGWISYSLSKSEREIASINDGKYFPARYDRTHDLAATINYKFSQKIDLSLTYVYATGNTYTQPTSWYFINNLPVKEYTEYNNARMPNYNRTDIGINYWFKKDCGLNFSIYNAFAINNPIYVFPVIKQNPKTNDIMLDMKQKKLYTIIPSVSWNFKF